jgi:hypothetical protein
MVALQVGAVVEALRQKRDRVKLRSPQKLRFPHPWVLVFFIFLNLLK